MKAAFYSGAAGLMAQQTALDNIGHNLANINNAGYKNQRIGFESLMYRTMYLNSEDAPLTGTGVRAIDLGIDHTQGNFQQTNVFLDFAIQGNGMFAIESEGKRSYTRNGSFSMGLAENGTAYLTDIAGGFVLDAAGNRIQLPVDVNGMPVTEGLADRIGVFVIQRPSVMTALAGNRYATNEQTGAVRVGINHQDYTLKQGVLEQANVHMEDEMTRMIMAQRAFQLSARVVQTADEIEQNVNTLRG